MKTHWRKDFIIGQLILVLILTGVLPWMLSPLDQRVAVMAAGAIMLVFGMMWAFYLAMPSRHVLDAVAAARDRGVPDGAIIIVGHDEPEDEDG